MGGHGLCNDFAGEKSDAFKSLTDTEYVWCLDAKGITLVEQCQAQPLKSGTKSRVNRVNEINNVDDYVRCNDHIAYIIKALKWQANRTVINCQIHSDQFSQLRSLCTIRVHHTESCMFESMNATRLLSTPPHALTHTAYMNCQPVIRSYEHGPKSW